jgi:hypothetical protein
MLFEGAGIKVTKGRHEKKHDPADVATGAPENPDDK